MMEGIKPFTPFRRKDLTFPVTYLFLVWMSPVQIASVQCARNAEDTDVR